VESVLREKGERFERRDRLKARGHDFDTVVGRVAELFNMTTRDILETSKKPQRVQSRNLVGFWAVRELGLLQSAVSKAVERGTELAAAHDFRIED